MIGYRKKYFDDFEMNDFIFQNTIQKIYWNIRL